MEQQNQQKIKSVSEIIKNYEVNNNVENIKNKCFKKICKILDKEELTNEDVQQLNTLMNILNNINKCNMDKWVNTKEEGEQLKGLTMGSQNFEDWHIMRLLLKIKIIESLLGGGSK